MKTIILSALTVLLSAQFAYADVYSKADAFGMGEVQTWISGKKRREVTNISFPGLPAHQQVVITRLDKDVEWTIDNELQVYEEKSIHISLKSSEVDEGLSDPASEALGEKMLDDTDKAAKEICAPDLIVNPQKQVIAGFEATGYASKCPEGTPNTTMWIGPLKDKTLIQYEKETTAFQNAYQDLLYKEYTSRQDKMARKLIGAMGNAMSQGLLGIRADKMPKGVVLRMEQTGDMGDGVKRTNRMVEIMEIRAEKADASIFEIPEGYKKVTNLAELQSERVAQQMGFGGMVAQMKQMQAEMPADTVQSSSYETTYESQSEEQVAQEQSINGEAAEEVPAESDSNNVVYED